MASSTPQDQPEADSSTERLPFIVSLLDAVETLKQLGQQGKLTKEDILHSKGLLFMHTKKIGLGIASTEGFGVVLARMDTDEGPDWSPPLPIRVDGFGLGAVIGYSEQHTLITLATEEDIQAFMKDEPALKIGVDFGLSLAGVVDKIKAVNTQTQQEASSGVKTRAFTISKGVLVDVAVDGSGVEADRLDIARCYGRTVVPADILQGRVLPPAEASQLRAAIKEFIA